ncbi:hypothetical protein [Actinoplanes sp. CA-252034]|uniref:hypothetical protein n=1 Tax=Actinoplanes sp. CA-252034 TaxID=3239906 RepID=UPI003D982F86
MLWDWDNTYVEFDNPDTPGVGGGTVYLGVAWYDQEFFTERGGAGFSRMHRKVYEMIGIPESAITIEHFLCAEVAEFKATEDAPDSPAALTAGVTI